MGKQTGSSSKSYDYYGTILIGLGEGPIDAIVRILEDSKEIYSGPLVRPSDGAPSIITIPDRGALRVHWGTDSESSDSILAKFEQHPEYKGRGCIIGDAFLFGRERSNVPNWEIVYRKKANQTLITGASAELDSNAQGNLVAFAAELVTSKSGLALSNSRFHQPSWQGIADALNTAEMRSLYAASPLLSSQETVRSIFARMGETTKIWSRKRADGLIELGRWTPPSDESTVQLITADELTEDLEYDTEDMDELPTEYVIKFTDADRVFKESTEKVPDVAASRAALTPKTETISHPEIHNRAQARRVILEYMRQRRGGSLKGSCKVRRSRGIGIRPGDYFRIDVDPIPGGSGVAVLMRCLGRRFGPVGPVTLQFQSEPLAAPVPFVKDWSDNTPGITPALTPLFYERTIALEPDMCEAPSVSILACRPDDDVTGMHVLYDSDLVHGTYPVLGTVQGFALPVELPQAVTAAATTIRVNTFAEFVPGVRADRERWRLEDGTGASPVEARDDRLLLILIAKNPSTGRILPIGDRHYFEVCAIESITMVGPDAWDLGVMRGRLKTSPMAFDTSGGATFPDPFLHFEGWVIPADSIVRLKHPDFVSLMQTSTEGYFRFRTYSRFAIYDPEVSFEAGLQLTATWTTFGFTWPQHYDWPAELCEIPTSLPTDPRYDDLVDTSLLMVGLDIVLGKKNRGGYFELIGWREIVPGTAITDDFFPRMYRTMSILGTIQQWVVRELPFEPPVVRWDPPYIADTDHYSGSWYYAPLGGVVHDAWHVSATNGRQPVGCSDDGYLGVGEHYVISDSRITRNLSWDGSNYNFAGLSYGYNTGGATVTLADEDTDETAYDRKINVRHEYPWPEYWDVVLAGGPDDPVVFAHYSKRTNDPSFERTDGRMHVVVNTPAPGWTYKGTVKLYRRQIGETGPFEVWKTETIDLQANEVGVVDTVYDVPVLRGYDVYVTKPAISAF